MFLCDIPDAHCAAGVLAVRREGYGDVVGAVYLLADNARAKREAVETDHQVKHCGAVGRLYRARIRI